MGLFKQMKDMKQMVAEAPGLLTQGTALAANAQSLAEQQSTAPATPAPLGPANAAFAPIAGVSLEVYVSISKQSAAAGHDVAETRMIAVREGVSPADWSEAVPGWNARLQSDPTVAKSFAAQYAAR